MIHSPVFQGFQGERPKKVLATSLTLGGNWTVSGNPKLPNIQTGRECVSFAQVLRPVPKNTVNPRICSYSGMPKRVSRKYSRFYHLAHGKHRLATVNRYRTVTASTESQKHRRILAGAA
jgi:hypothetical protein